MKATINSQVLATSEQTVVVEGNHYFPPESINFEHFSPSTHSTHCPWKGDASYYHITVAGERKENAAWYYPEPKQAAAHIKDYIAFYKNLVNVSE